MDRLEAIFENIVEELRVLQLFFHLLDYASAY